MVKRPVPSEKGELNEILLQSQNFNSHCNNISY